MLSSCNRVALSDCFLIEHIGLQGELIACQGVISGRIYNESAYFGAFRWIFTGCVVRLGVVFYLEVCNARYTI